MQTIAFETMDRCAGYLDFLRSRLLRIVMRIEWMRPLFYTRALRLGTLFTISSFLLLGLSLLFPLWMLLIGPLVYGVPHIFSSMRYFHYTASGPHREAHSRRVLAFSMMGLILLAVFGYRILVSLNIFQLELPPQLSEWRGSTYVEGLALAATFLVGALIYGKPARSVIGGIALLTPLALAFWFQPIWTIGALVLIHNFIGFVYWILAARSRSDRAVAISALLVTLGVTGAIFLGAFDWVYSYVAPAAALDFASLTVTDTGRMIAPWSEQEALWLHATVAFAFGQGLHYFVWLKAVPDQHHYHDVPTSFRQSLGLLRADFGRLLAVALVVLSIGSIVIWSFMSFQEARMIYFCLAAYHGYLEIAGLGLSISASRE